MLLASEDIKQKQNEMALRERHCAHETEVLRQVILMGVKVIVGNGVDRSGWLIIEYSVVENVYNWFY